MTHTCGWCEWSGEDLEAARVHLVEAHPELVQWFRRWWGMGPVALLGSPVWFWFPDKGGGEWQPATVTWLGAAEVTFPNGRVRWGWPWQVRPRKAGEQPPSGKPAEVADMADVVRAARALLHRLDHMTMEEFSGGGEREEREQLRGVLGRLLEVLPEEVAT